MPAAKRDLLSCALTKCSELKRMRSVCLLLLSLMFTTAVMAQPKGYRPVANTTAFQQSLQKATAPLQSIESDFSQTKHLSMLADKVKSKGKFYYRREDTGRIEYTNPFT